MAKYKITQEHDKCIGCGACIAVCKDNWKMGSDGKATPIKTESDSDCNKKAEAGCPVHCIKVTENK
jgi:ferredoxin